MSLRDLCDTAFVLLLDEVRSAGASVGDAREAVEEWLTAEPDEGVSGALVEIEEFRRSRGVV